MKFILEVPMTYYGRAFWDVMSRTFVCTYKSFGEHNYLFLKAKTEEVGSSENLVSIN
jgi:hypothetical protein